EAIRTERKMIREHHRSTFEELIEYASRSGDSSASRAKRRRAGERKPCGVSASGGAHCGLGARAVLRCGCAERGSLQELRRLALDRGTDARAAPASPAPQCPSHQSTLRRCPSKPVSASASYLREPRETA